MYWGGVGRRCQLVGKCQIQFPDVGANNNGLAATQRTILNQYAIVVN